MRNMILAAALAVALAACGQAQAASSDQPVDAQKEIQTVLNDAVTAAKAYGQQRLGHYLDMDIAALKELGLAYPANVIIEVDTDHTTYCLTATHGALESSDPWRVASVDSTTQRVEAGDSCGGR